jgi:dTDP-4-amino-4,6-dideoxygalactose transaminase
VYHVFAVRARERDALRAHLDAAGVDTLVHYPVALSDQPAFAPYGPAHCPVASEASHELVSLPLHPSLADADVERVAGAVAAFERGRVPA